VVSEAHLRVAPPLVDLKRVEHVMNTHVSMKEVWSMSQISGTGACEILSFSREALSSAVTATVKALAAAREVTQKAVEVSEGTDVARQENWRGPTKVRRESQMI
jgi:hypothetical protein